jgi:glutaredoxin-related protein
MRRASQAFLYKGKKMITLYSKPNCPYCDRAKIWFEKNNIAYETIDVLADEAALAFIKEQGHKTVPQIYFENSLLVEGGYTGLSKQDPAVLREIITQREAS